MKYAKKRTYSRKTKGKQIRAVAKASRALMLRSVETKHYDYGIVGNISNNDFYTWSPTQQVVVGNNSNTRIGDSILLQSLVMNFSLNVNATVLNTKWRIMVGWSRSTVANASVAVNVLTTSDVFHPPSSSSVNLVNRIVNTNVFTCIYDEIADVNSNTTSGKDLKSTYATIKLNMKKFDYATLSGTHGKTKNMYIIFLAYVPGIAVGAAVGSVDGTFMLKFKDP